ncbi:MAG: hypothetical protein VKP62_05955 [Candidatus Sericytochromatia bacterium]|nr:hypothetical protein [Candidatus Sericytochromatia bacterium]
MVGVGLRARNGGLKQRTGSVLLTALVIVSGLAAVAASLHLMFKGELDQNVELQRISLAKLQTLYLAEMGVNHVMFGANRAANVAAANPFMPLGAVASSSISVDFTQHVALTRGVAGAQSSCLVTRTGTHDFRVDASLSLPGVGNFTRRVDFSAAYDAGGVGQPAAWELSAYKVY